MDRQQVLEQIRPAMGIQVRRMDADPGIRVQVAPERERIAIRPSRGARSIEVAPAGIAPILQRAVVAEPLARRISPSTLGTVLTESLAGQNSSLLIQNGQVVDIVPAGHYREINPERVLNAIERVVPEADYQRVLVLPHQVVQLETAGVEERPVVRGDLIRAGVLVRFSPIGADDPLVQSYALRLACTNGATTNHVVREYHFGGGNGGGDGFWNWFRQSCQEAYGSLEAITGRWQQMREEGISAEDRAFVLEALLKEAGIRGSAAEAVRAEALRQPPENSYDLFNLLSFAYTHVIERPEAIVRAQRVGAQFAAPGEAHRRVCPTCRRQR